jgi:molybdopterin molybdotransferase
MITWQEAHRSILDQAKPLPLQIGPISSSSLGAILGDDVLADMDAPPFDKALMDGFALSGDTSAQSDGWPLGDGVYAGGIPGKALEPGYAVPVATGAPIPTGADRVIPIERTEKINGLLKVKELPGIGDFIATKGADYKAGDTVLKRGTVLCPSVAGALAAVGKTALRLIPAPTVSVISTGSELVEPNMKPMGGQIRNSNASMLLSGIHRAGCLPKYLGIAPDCAQALRNLIAEGITHPVLILSGGVSVGEKDLVRATLEELGVKIIVHGIKLKPGRPFLFGITPSGGLVFGLPGNPTSSLANFDLLIHPALLALRGYRNPGPHFQVARMEESLIVDNNRPTLRPVSVCPTNFGYIAYDLGAKGSFELGVLTRAYGWLELAPGRVEIQKDEEVRVLVPELSAVTALLLQTT